MIVVGYDATAGVGSPESYWIIRNSWGTWGEAGYVKVQMTNDNAGACAMYRCGQVVAGPAGVVGVAPHFQRHATSATCCCAASKHPPHGQLMTAPPLSHSAPCSGLMLPLTTANKGSSPSPSPSPAPKPCKGRKCL